MPTNKHYNAAETEFAARLEAEGKLYFYQPKTFLLPKPMNSYLPDFYVVEDKKFYEVIGTRQAFSLQRRKIEAFRKTYPHLDIEVINQAAWKRGPLSARTRMVKPRTKSPFLNAATKKNVESITSPNETQSFLIGQLLSGKFRSLSDLSRHMGIHECTVRGWLLGLYLPGYKYTEVLGRFQGEKVGSNVRAMTNVLDRDEVGIPMSRFKGDGG